MARSHSVGRENDALQTVLQQLDIEVDQQAQPKLRCFQVRDHLFSVHKVDCLYGLEFDNHQAPHDKVHPVRPDWLIAIQHFDCLFSLEGESVGSELQAHRLSIKTLEVPGPSSRWTTSAHAI